MKKTLFVLSMMVMSLSQAMAMEVTFSPRAMISEEYTDNVDLTPDDEQEDFITTTGVGATLGFRGATAGLTLAYNPEYASYKNNSDLNTWRHYASMDANWQFARNTRLGLSDSFVISDDPADELETTTERRGRNKYLNNSIHGYIAHQFGREDSAELGYDYTWLDNELEEIEDSQSESPYGDLTWWFVENQYGFQAHVDYTRSIFDRSDNFQSWFGDFRLRKRFTRHFDMFVQYAHMTTEYDKDPFAEDIDEVEDYTIYNPGVGFNYVAGENTNISIAVGYAIRDREFSDDDEGPTIISEISTVIPYRRGAITLDASSGYTQDTFSTENRGFNVYAGAGALAEYGFTSRFRGDVTARYHFIRYLDADPTVDDHLVAAGPGVSYQALPWMRFRLDYTYRTLFSDEPENEYTENRAMVSMILEPSSPYRWN